MAVHEESSGAGSFTARVRGMLRDQLIDAATALAAELPWTDVTMSRVAKEVGVSRQTVYREFGNKDALGEAMAIEIARTLIADAVEALNTTDDLLEGVKQAMQVVLTRAEEDPLTRAVLAAARRDDELLPFLTTKAEAILGLATNVLVEQVAPRVPEFETEQVRILIDTAVRLIVSHIVQPGGTPDEVAELSAWILGRLLGVSDADTLRV